MTPSVLLYTVSGLMLLVLTAYVLLGGADFGGGVWDLFARGPRSEEQRAAIARAMGPVWEANHVWLIFFVVLFFTAFPSAFSALMVALFLPLHLVLFGVILRGASFVFRAPGAIGGRARRAWASTFGAASTITVFLLGAALAAISTGGIRSVQGAILAPPGRSWLSLFALCTGAVALCVAAYLAAVYLTLETSGDLREDFRRRAILAGGAVTAFAVLDLPLMAREAPRLWQSFAQPAALPLIGAALVLAAASFLTLLSRRERAARLFSGASTAVLLWGWARAQWPYIVYPDFTIQGSAAPVPALMQILWTLPIGLVLLAPSLWLLFRLFKGRNPAGEAGRRPGPRPAS